MDIRAMLFGLVVLMVGVDARRITTRNNLGYTIWVGSFGELGLTPNGGGWQLDPNQEIELDVDDAWNGRFWARTGCQFDGNGMSQQPCETGDCGNKLQCNGATGVPPATLAEFKLKGNAGDDFYDVSNVDGFNVPVTITPLDQTGEGYRCTSTSCPANINAECPEELQLKGASGEVVGCKSACTAFNTDEYCCRGAYSTPETCLSSNWPTNYPADVFKRLCPQAYSYAYDDNKSTWTCRDTGYSIIFG